MAGLAFVFEALRVQADIRVVAVVVVEPDGVVYYEARLLSAYLAEPAVNGQPAVDVRPPCS